MVSYLKRLVAKYTALSLRKRLGRGLLNYLSTQIRQSYTTQITESEQKKLGKMPHAVTYANRQLEQETHGKQIT